MKRVTFKVFEALFFLLTVFWLCLKFIFNKLFQLPSKEPTSLTSRIGDGGSLSLDKKKPFSRPFAKGRLETNGSSVRMASPTPNESSGLLRQNHELRQRLQEESSSYRRRLDTYKQAQSNQSALVSRLQAKVLQYKQRCSELETQMHDTVPLCPQYTDGSKATAVSSTPLPSICPKTNYSSSTAPMSLPAACASTDVKPPGNYCSDESDDSFERKRNDEERKL